MNDHWGCAMSFQKGQTSFFATDSKWNILLGGREQWLRRGRYTADTQVWQMRALQTNCRNWSSEFTFYWIFHTTYLFYISHDSHQMCFVYKYYVWFNKFSLKLSKNSNNMALHYQLILTQSFTPSCCCIGRAKSKWAPTETWPQEIIHEPLFGLCWLKISQQVSDFMPCAGTNWVKAESQRQGTIQCKI